MVDNGKDITCSTQITENQYLKVKYAITLYRQKTMKPQQQPSIDTQSNGPD